MADISSDQALNGLKVKTDSLPDNWYVTLVNPQNGEPGENMSIARFIELLTDKMPIATSNNKGLMSSEDSKYLSLFRKTLKAKEEINLGSFWTKAFCVSDASSGQSALYLLNAFAGCVLMPGSGALFSQKIEDGKIFFGRKETNGEVYLINNLDRNAVISIRG